MPKDEQEERETEGRKRDETGSDVGTGDDVPNSVQDTRTS